LELHIKFIFLLLLQIFIINTLFASSTSKITLQRISLNLEANVTILNVGEGIELAVIGIYSDSSTKDISTSDSAEMNGTILTVKKDDNIAFSGGSYGSSPKD